MEPKYWNILSNLGQDLTLLFVPTLCFLLFRVLQFCVRLSQGYKQSEDRNVPFLQSFNRKPIWIQRPVVRVFSLRRWGPHDWDMFDFGCMYFKLSIVWPASYILCDRWIEVVSIYIESRWENQFITYPNWFKNYYDQNVMITRHNRIQ